MELNLFVKETCLPIGRHVTIRNFKNYIHMIYMNRNKYSTGKILITLFVCLLLLGHSGHSQNVTLTTTGHPRIFLNPAKVAQLKTLYNNIVSGNRGKIPFNGSLFPVTGSLSYEFFLDTLGMQKASNYNFFDQYEGGTPTRNHFFIRKANGQNYNIWQILLQKAGSISPVGSAAITIDYNKWNKITVGWNTTTDSAYFKVESYSTGNWNLFSQVKFKITDTTWVPNNQNFIFQHKGLIDNISLYTTYKPVRSSCIAKFKMEVTSLNAMLDSVGSKEALVKNMANDNQLLPNPTNASNALKMAYDPLSANGYGTSQLYMKSTDYHANCIIQQVNFAKTTWLPNTLSKFNCSLCRSEGDYNMAVLNTAFIWQITGDVVYRNKALTLIDTLLKNPGNCEAYSACGLNDQATRGRIYAMSLLYDWMYNDITPAKRKMLVDSIQAALHFRYPGYGLNLERQICGSQGFVSSSCNCVSSSPVISYYGGHSYSTCRTALIAALSIIDAAPVLQPLVNQLSAHFKNGFDPYMQYISNNDGGSPKGYSYPGGESWDVTYLLNTITTDKHKVTWPASAYKRYMYGYGGKTFRYPNIGDDFEANIKGYMLYITHIPSFFIYASRFNKDGYAQYMNENVSSMFRNGWEYGFFHDIIFGDSLAAPVSFYNLPLAKKFKVSGIVSCRNNWKAENTALLTFKSSNMIGTNHIHADNNSLELFYKSPLLLDAGFYDSYGTDQWTNYFTRTIAHNAVTIYNPKQVLVNKAALDGGQLTTEQLGVNYPTLAEVQPNGLRWVKGIDTLTGFDNHSSQDYTFINGDATRAYPVASVKQSVREVIYTRNNVGAWSLPMVFVFDKVKSTDSTFTKRVHWHTQQKPTKQSNRYTIINKEGKAYLDILYPTTAKDTLIGGPGFEYWVNNPATGVGANHPLSGTNQDTSEAGKWRIDVSPKKKDTLDYFLHSIAVADAGNSAAPTMLKGSSNGIIYAIANNNLIVTFSKSDVPLSNVTFNVVSSGFTNGIFTGLKYNSRYNIVKTSTSVSLIEKPSGGQYTSSNAGVVYAKNISITTGLDEVEKDQHISLYPSPCSHELTVSAVLNGRGSYQLSIINVLGQIVLQKEIAVTQDFFEQKIMTGSFERGVYFLSIKGNDGNYLAKFIKE